ncbi:hypothetical protein [Streptomyces sp. NPDC020965]|uniref:hypothetical protein n=1 Tax=Streptomyces sp. NPDC020965 TaxID=3365105 RepID=UPI00378B5575
MHKRTLATAIAVTSASLVAGLAPAAVAAPAKPVKATSSTAKETKHVSDFNGDGYRDLVIQEPGSYLDFRPGSIVVLYGSKKGVDSAHRQIIDQDTPGVPGTGERADRFGRTSVAGDYDGDGFTDLAIAADGEDMSFGGTYRRNAGQTVIVWGGKKGLTKHGGVSVKQTTPTTIDVRRSYSLVAGDFNGDGTSDLATSDGGPAATDEVLYGPINRKTGAPKSIAGLGVPGPTHYTVVDSGDVTGDGIGDLLVNAYGPSGYQMTLRRGTKKGLAAPVSLKGADGKPLPTARWGGIAIGDLDKDGYADMVLGNFGSRDDQVFTGRVMIIYGDRTGQSARPVQVITQNTPGVPDEVEQDDNFGGSISVGDINADGYADLAIGNNTEGVEGAEHTGQVTTLLGGPQGVTGEGAQAYDRGTQGVPEGRTPRDFFGTAVQLADLNGDQRADLVVGTGGSEEMHEGRINILFNDGRGAITGYGSHAYYAHNLGLRGGNMSGFSGSFGR